jgi:hypothetical protein
MKEHAAVNMPYFIVNKQVVHDRCYRSVFNIVTKRITYVLLMLSQYNALIKQCLGAKCSLNKPRQRSFHAEEDDPRAGFVHSLRVHPALNKDIVFL